MIKEFNIHNGKLTISDFEEKDVEYLRTLFLEVRKSTFDWMDTTSFELTDFDKETEGELILSAHLNGKLLGFISVWVAFNFVHHLYVDQDYQNQGVGSALLNAVIERINLPLRLKCEELNIKAISFYNKMGFIEKYRGPSATGNFIFFELAL